MYGYTQNKANYLNRLRRIEGQIRGLQRMVEDDKYCIDILTQVAAATKALQSVALGLLEEHLSHCVVDAVAEGGATGCGAQAGRASGSGKISRARQARVIPLTSAAVSFVVFCAEPDPACNSRPAGRRQHSAE